MTTTVPFLDKLIPIEGTHTRKSCLFKGPPGSGKTEIAHSIEGPTFSSYADTNKDTLVTIRQRRPDIDSRQVNKWSDFEQVLLPAIVNRRLPVDNIIVDTWSFLYATLIKQCSGTHKDSRQDWGDVLDKAMQAMNLLVSSTTTTANHPGYNIIVTCHTKKFVDEKGNVTGIGPVIQGQFIDRFEAFFDYVLVCEKVIKLVPPTTPDGKGTYVPQTIYKVHTISPNFTLENAKAPPHWPRTFEIPEGKSGWDQIKRYWNSSAAEEQKAGTSTTAPTGAKE